MIMDEEGATHTEDQDEEYSAIEKAEFNEQVTPAEQVWFKFEVIFCFFFTLFIFDMNQFKQKIM